VIINSWVNVLETRLGVEKVVRIVVKPAVRTTGSAYDKGLSEYSLQGYQFSSFGTETDDPTHTHGEREREREREKRDREKGV
jgi:hypothetical protein